MRGGQQTKEEFVTVAGGANQTWLIDLTAQVTEVKVVVGVIMIGGLVIMTNGWVIMTSGWVIMTGGLVIMTGGCVIMTGGWVIMTGGMGIITCGYAIMIGGMVTITCVDQCNMWTQLILVLSDDQYTCRSSDERIS